jgi:hypothetical protein
VYTWKLRPSGEKTELERSYPVPIEVYEMRVLASVSLIAVDSSNRKLLERVWGRKRTMTGRCCGSEGRWQKVDLTEQNEFKGEEWNALAVWELMGDALYNLKALARRDIHISPNPS